MTKLLLADDDDELRVLVGEWLEHDKFTVDLASDGAECRDLLVRSKYDVLVLDWTMPEISGLEICRWFRDRGGTTPILMLTGKNEIDDKEIGFAAGVDDYLTKPFEMRELAARVRAILRRGDVAVSRAIKIGPLVIEPETHSVTVDNVPLKLTATEFSVLEYFARHPNQVFSTGALLDRVWSTTSDVSPDTVRVYIKRLRAKLDAMGHPELIENIHGVGYKLNPETKTDAKS